MKKYYYDLHIHSCLSPCGDNDSTPDSILGMGEINGLDIMALTDHNTCKNCPAFFESASRHGILAIAGMELTTSEEIHMVCLFENLENAMAFDEYVYSKRILIPNRADIFGEQFVCDSEDNIIGNDEYLLSNATQISLDETPSLVEKYGGICYPAHIDRPSNSVSAVLGVFPKYLNFSCAEIHNREEIYRFSEFSSLPESKLLISSDAHYLWQIKEKDDYISLDEIPNNSKEAGKELIKKLRERV